MSQGSLKYALVGFVTLDGNGNVTTGSTTEANEQFSSVCTDSLAGTNVVNADGTGTATITATNTAGGCGSEIDTFALVLSSGGNLVNVVLTTPARKAVAYGALYKQ